MERGIAAFALALTILYIGTHYYLAYYGGAFEFDPDLFASRGIGALLEIGTFIASGFGVWLSLSKPKVWFGEAHSYRFYFLIGCFAATIYGLAAVIDLLENISQP